MIKSPSELSDVHRPAGLKLGKTTCGAKECHKEATTTTKPNDARKMGDSTGQLLESGRANEYTLQPCENVFTEAPDVGALGKGYGSSGSKQPTKNRDGACLEQGEAQIGEMQRPLGDVSVMAEHTIQIARGHLNVQAPATTRTMGERQIIRNGMDMD